MKRFTVFSDMKQLQEHIPPQYLIPRFGGNAAPYTLEDFQKEVAEKENELFANGIWRIQENEVTTTVTDTTDATDDTDAANSSIEDVDAEISTN